MLMIESSFCRAEFLKRRHVAEHLPSVVAAPLATRHDVTARRSIDASADRGAMLGVRLRFALSAY